MDVRQMRYFMAVADELNFSRAARRLHMSQPPLSLQIKSLEEELGTTLFERNRRKVHLTEPGRVLLERVRAVLAQIEQASDDVRRASRGEVGEIRVAFTGSAPLFEPFPRFLQAFRRGSPAVRVAMSQMSTALQLQALGEGRIDVGFLRPSYRFTPGPGIAWRALWEDELLAILPAAHRCAVEDEACPMEALAEEAFVLFSEDLGCGLRDHVLALSGQAGFAPRIVQEAREGVTILALVAAGAGVSIMPATYRNVGVAGISHKRLVSAASRSRMLLAWRSSDSSPLLRRFVSMACDWPGFFSTGQRQTSV